MKKNIRTIGIDDAAFERRKSSQTFVFGVIVRGSSLVEGVLRTEIEVDGMDATSKIGQMIIESKFHKQLRTIILNSTTIGAFNIINVNMLHKITGLQILTILSRVPDHEEVKKALSHLADYEDRYEILLNSPPLQKIEYENKLGQKCTVHIQQVGFENVIEIKNILKNIVGSSCLPECLRLADLIGQSFKDFIF